MRLKLFEKCFKTFGYFLLILLSYKLCTFYYNLLYGFLGHVILFKSSLQCVKTFRSIQLKLWSNNQVINLHCNYMGGETLYKLVIFKILLRIIYDENLHESWIKTYFSHKPCFLLCEVYFSQA